ncbi:MAG: hypothetical protein IJ057_12890 [Bacteroidales bacterium]|nr:hypothetical protein [Bacteroidales bacterium]
MIPKEELVAWLGDRMAFYKEACVVINNDTLTLFDEKDLEPIPVQGFRVAPWGVDNDLPQKVMAKIDAAEIVGTNANFNWKVAYGLGPKLVDVIRDPETNRVKDYKEVIEGEAYDWYMRNNVPLLLQEIMTDLSYFGNAFPLLIAGPKEKGGKKRVGIRSIVHREAMFSRWGIDKNNLINRHLYCAKWDESPSREEIQDSYVIDEFNAVADINNRLLLGKDTRMCFPIYIPSPGRPYYSYPNWWSIFRSGWYDQLTSIPALKKAILKHNLGVRHIIYIADEYFKEKEELLAIDKNNHKGRKELYNEVVKQLCEQVTGEENAGKAIVSKMKFMPNGNSASFEKMMTVDTIKNDISGGEYLTDYETGANIISYAMDVHPSLIGATPGKNSNSLSGSNIREIFIMKQSLSKPMAYLALQWWPVVRQINGWGRNLEIMIQDSLFTTLDQSKSGEIKTQNNLTQ